MKPFIRYGLILSAVVVAGGGFALAAIHMPPSTMPVSPAQVYSASGGSSHSNRGGGKFFAEFDLNHDGKVTHEELDRALAQEFAQSAGSSPAMTEAQFITYRLKDLREKTDQMFHRADWNGDGRLSLEEYATPERVRFEYADRDGTGIITCGHNAPARSRGDSQRGGRTAYGARGHGGGGRGGFCKSDDLNHDGQITRAEFDTATAQEFASAAKGGSLTPDQFYGIVSAHIRDSAAHMFTRLDTNHDGKLDRGEFAATEARYFARMDRNNDGAVTRDEISSQRRYGANGTAKPGRT
ncbi:MAG TPA: EF-hand domain-containing protein [Rhizomicrobium sp.]